MPRVFTGTWSSDSSDYTIDYTFTLHDDGTWQSQEIHESGAHGYYADESGGWRREGRDYILGERILHEQADGSFMMKDVRLVESKP
jgi:hypothetical protein